MIDMTRGLSHDPVSLLALSLLCLFAMRYTEVVLTECAHTLNLIKLGNEPFIQYDQIMNYHYEYRLLLVIT